ncbi:hypothetical protein [Candidatus Coxiella mudrowiae]|uniref:hypothetical protein n=1 Tax=Candidatus Coxiella mudrowiae TaxID=2054173 RepID=UPI000AC865A3|nr:hypothetical protein [Candidatus Coxiella mudrowiae]
MGGTVTYDLFSLLRDCYIDWPSEQVAQWVLQFHRQVCEEGVLKDRNPEQFLRWFDWIGLQGHLNYIGLFARLNERDQKPNYL